jgi:hypothetical protein
MQVDATNVGARRPRQRGLAWMAHRYVGDDVVDHVRCGLRHPAGVACGAKHAALATEGQQLVVAVRAAAQPQRPVRQDAALEEGVEFVLSFAPVLFRD